MFTHPQRFTERKAGEDVFFLKMPSITLLNCESVSTQRQITNVTIVFALENLQAVTSVVVWLVRSTVKANMRGLHP